MRPVQLVPLGHCVAALPAQPSSPTAEAGRLQRAPAYNTHPCRSCNTLHWCASAFRPIVCGEARYRVQLSCSGAVSGGLAGRIGISCPGRRRPSAEGITAELIRKYIEWCPLIHGPKHQLAASSAEGPKACRPESTTKLLGFIAQLRDSPQDSKIVMANKNADEQYLFVF